MQDDKSLGAWLLPIGNNITVAVGRHELKYIEYPDKPVTLPGLPAYCETGFVWRKRFVPILDLLGLVTRRRQLPPKGDAVVAVVAYEQGTEETLAVGAIALRGIPKPITVETSQAAATSELTGAWPQLSLAAFRADDKLYPVLDLHQLFDTTPSDLLKRR